MKITTLQFLILLSTFAYGQEVLPDNYLPISFTINNNDLIGKCEYLGGFTVSAQLLLVWKHHTPVSWFYLKVHHKDQVPIEVYGLISIDIYQNCFQ